MNPALWGLLTALGWGSADFIARFTGRRMGHERALLGMLLVSALALSAVLWLSGQTLVVQLADAWLLAATGLGVLLATFLLYWGLARGPVTVVSPIVASYPAFNLVLAVALGSRPAWGQWLCIALVMLGVIVVARASRSFELHGNYDAATLRRTVWISVASSASFGAAIAAGQEAATVYGELQTTVAARWIGLVALALVLLLRPGEGGGIPRSWWPVLAVQGLLDGGAYLAIFAASGEPNAEIAAVVGSAFSAITVVLARVFLREAMTAIQWAGTAIVVGGVAALAAQG
ncbi:MAG: DMT family transporter [Kiloniellales bacterium]|nr:DMT family transporter [Kiloniellales bacterium]